MPALTAIFFVDIDDAEISIPGAFVGQPLAIKLQGGNTNAASEGMSYSFRLSARLEKK